MCRLSWNLGTSTSWNPLGLFRPVRGLLYLYLTFSSFTKHLKFAAYFCHWHSLFLLNAWNNSQHNRTSPVDERGGSAECHHHMQCHIIFKNCFVLKQQLIRIKCCKHVLVDYEDSKIICICYLLLPGDHEVSCIKQKGIKCQTAVTNEFHNYATTEECSKTNVMSHKVDMT